MEQLVFIVVVVVVFKEGGELIERSCLGLFTYTYTGKCHP